MAGEEHPGCSLINLWVVTRTAFQAMSRFTAALMAAAVVGLSMSGTEAMRHESERIALAARDAKAHARSFVKLQNATNGSNATTTTTTTTTAAPTNATGNATTTKAGNATTAANGTTTASGNGTTAAATTATTAKPTTSSAATYGATLAAAVVAAVVLSA